MVRLFNRLLLSILCAITLSCASSTFVDDKDVVVTRLVDVALRLEFDGANERASVAPSHSGWLESMVQSVGAITKGGANALEQRVNNLNIFFVRERYQASPDAGLVRHIYLTDVDLTDSIVLKNLYLGRYVMYMIGNVGDLSKGGTVDYTPKMLRDFAFNIDDLGLSNTNNDWAYRGLPIFSRDVVDIKFEGDGVKPIGGRLRFGVAKVNFECNIDPALDGSIISISSVALINTATGFAPFGTVNSLVESNQELYMTEYSENQRRINGMHYVFPNMAGNNAAVTDPKDRTSVTAPSTATYIYLRATYVNNSGNKEVYGFFVYLGDQDIFSNFDTRAGNEYNLTINIKGIDPDSDPRISFLKISGGTWSGGGSVRINELAQIEVIIKAQNLKGQNISFLAKAEPSPNINQVPGMCQLDLRDSSTPKDLINGQQAIHYAPLQFPSLVRVDSDNFEKRYILGFTPLVKVNGNYPIKVAVSTAAGATTNMETPTIIITN